MTATAPAWLRAAVLATPRRFPAVVAAAVLPEARLSGPRSLAVAPAEVLAADPQRLELGVLGLAGPASALPAGLARELAALAPSCAAAGLIGTIEHRLLTLLLAAVARRAVDDPQAYQRSLDRHAGPLAAGEAAIAGRLCDGRTADACAHRVARAAGCAVRVCPATGGTLPLGPGAADRLGGGGLGLAQAIGRYVSAPDLGCRIELGPVDAEAAEALRPGGARHDPVRTAVLRSLPPCLAAEVDLLVAPALAVAMPAALGRTARLAGPPPTVERERLWRLPD